MYTTLSTTKYETHMRIVSCLPNCFSYFTLNIDNGQHNGYKRNSDKILYKNTKDYKQTLDIIQDSIVISVQYEGFNRAFLPNYGHDFKIPFRIHAKVLLVNKLLDILQIVLIRRKETNILLRSNNILKI